MGLSRFLRRARWDEERRRELEAHLAIDVDERVARGLSEPDARDAARRKLGSVLRIREEIYDMNTIGFLDSIWRDARHAARALRRSPAFSIVALLTLALGIGANASMLAIVHAVLWRALPFAEPERLVTIAESPLRSGRLSYSSMPNFRDWRSRADLFEAMAAYSGATFNMTGQGERGERLSGVEASAALFDLLGVRPLVGRGFTADDDRAAAAPVVVLSHEVWRRRFSADPAILGRTLVLNDRAFTIVGVMPSGFQFPIQSAPVDIWTPIEIDDFPQMQLRDGRLMNVVGRLKPAATLEAAQAQLGAIAAQLEREYPAANTGWGVQVTSLQERFVGGQRLALVTLLLAVTFVLLIASANVANLVVARYMSRHRELAVRSALGAGRRRLVQQLIVEQLVLAMGGGALGLLLFAWVRDVMLASAPDPIPRLAGSGLDWSVIVFTFAIAVGAALLVGLWVAIHATRIDSGVAGVALGGRGTAAESGRGRARGLLVGVEIALAMILLAGAGLTLRSLSKLTAVDPGFDAARVTAFHLEIPPGRYDTPSRRAAFFGSVLDNVRSRPGLESAAVAFPLPLGSPVAFPIVIDGRVEGGRIGAQYFTVSADYFATMRIPLRRGRVFASSDRAGAPAVALINETLARRYWPDADPLGQRVTVIDRNDYDRATSRTIVGIVGDVLHPAFDRPPAPQIYTPFEQAPSLWAALVVRANAAPLASQIAAAVDLVDRNVPVERAEPMSEAVARMMAPRRFIALLLAGFAAIALLLTTIGIAGMTAYTVAQRVQEIGVRMALGATRADVLRLVLGTTLRVAIAGTTIGIAGALVSTRVLRTLLFGVTPVDPLVFVASSAALLLVVAIAALIPASRAARIDPLAALRTE